MGLLFFWTFFMRIWHTGTQAPICFFFIPVLRSMSQTFSYGDGDLKGISSSDNHHNSKVTSKQLLASTGNSVFGTFTCSFLSLNQNRRSCCSWPSDFIKNAELCFCHYLHFSSERILQLVELDNIWNPEMDDSKWSRKIISKNT